MSFYFVDYVIMTRRIFANVILVVAFMASGASAQKAESIYTSLAEKDCKNMPNRTDDGVVYAAECKGVGGFKIDHYASEHSSIFDLKDNSGRTYELNIRSVIGSAAPAMLGDKVEWRIRRIKGKAEPYALIARYNVFDDPDNSNNRRSLLLIVKIAADSACVTDIVDPSVKAQNEQARRLADTAAAKPCLESK